MSEQPPWMRPASRTRASTRGSRSIRRRSSMSSNRARPSFIPNPQYVPQSGQPPYQGQGYQDQPYQDQPYQDQPYQDQPYQDQPLYGPPGSQPPYLGPGYGYGPQPPRRKRHLARNALAGVGGLVVAIIAITTISNAGRSVTAPLRGRPWQRLHRPLPRRRQPRRRRRRRSSSLSRDRHPTGSTSPTGPRDRT